MLSGKYGVHSNCIVDGKKTAVESVQDAFTRKSKSKKDEEEITLDDLLKEIGHLKLQLEFLKKVQSDTRVHKEMIEIFNADLPVSEQCSLLGLSRSIV